MDYAYTFGDPSTLYLNVTNRCTNSCCFCVRRYGGGLGSSQQLWGGPEPDLASLVDAVEEHGDVSDFEEIVWCGFGEPTFKLDLICEASAFLRQGGAKVRLNTNGHACLIHDRDVLHDLGRAVDVVSVSLNAPTRERYVDICNPGPNGASRREQALMWEAMIDFLTRSSGWFGEVHATVVAHVLDDDEIDACEALATRLGCHEFRLR